MSNKTKVLSFDEWINGNGFNFRPEQYDLYKFLYESGQQSRQDEVNELKMANHNLSVMTAEAESYSDYWKYELDKLQKRVDLALNKIYFWVSSENGDAAYVANSIGSILKGDQS